MHAAIAHALTNFAVKGKSVIGCAQWLKNVRSAFAMRGGSCVPADQAENLTYFPLHLAWSAACRGSACWALSIAR